MDTSGTVSHRLAQLHCATDSSQSSEPEATEEAARRLGVELIKQYGAQEQAELKVRAQISGSWFGGQLTAEERRELYWS